ncbi:MAG: NTP transferase domain-containing protein [Thermovenabulum sp.]|uniref:NTP transferase domain-containing protein n=1 Tax=Thermovenabulum sp. TaxID=3100335 RepID=UPI003C7CEC59
MKALILAGGSTDESLKDKGDNKALIKIGEKEMILYIAEVLKTIKDIDEIVAIGPKRLEGISRGLFSVVEEEGSLFENVKKGLSIFPKEEEILVLTSDIPMITKEALEDFIDKAKKSGADFCYPIVRKEINDKKFPGVKRTYVKVKEGTFTGGNVVYIKIEKVVNAVDKVESFFKYRKNPLKLAMIFGSVFLLKFLFGTLKIEELEKRVLELFGIKAKAIISDYPEIGTDVDKLSDLEIAEKVLTKGGGL